MTAAPEAGGSAPADAAAPALLSATGLVKAFGATPALRGADLTVRAGEIIAVIGPSGSGKSTLLHCAAGILRPDEGDVSYDGRRYGALNDGDLSEIRRTDFGFVFQFGQLIPELTCLQNAAMPLRLGGIARKPAEQQARELLRRLEVEDIADQRPGQVAGGQAQRVAVARAVVHGPAVIFADEPTGALDSLQGERVMALLVGLVRDGGAALVLVTHEPRVAAYSDREVLVRDGRTGLS
jgi:putative ABC transport system ATP-binding protein